MAATLIRQSAGCFGRGLARHRRIAKALALRRAAQTGQSAAITRSASCSRCSAASRSSCVSSSSASEAVVSTGMMVDTIFARRPDCSLQLQLSHGTGGYRGRSRAGVSISSDLPIGAPFAGSMPVRGRASVPRSHGLPRQTNADDVQRDVGQFQLLSLSLSSDTRSESIAAGWPGKAIRKPVHQF
jgi:hypothetical protein